MSDKKLNQEQIDSLINAFQQEGEEVLDELIQQQKKGMNYEEYNFEKPDKFNPENLKSLRNLSDTFGKNFSQQMSAHLRGMPVDFKFSTIEQIPYQTEYVEKMIKNQYVFCVVDLGAKDKGKIIIEFDINMIVPIHRKLLGAQNDKIKLEETRRPLTDIEKISMEEWVSDLMFPVLKDSFRNIAPELKLSVTNVLTEVQQAEITISNDMIALITFDVYIGEDKERKTTMRLCIPYRSIESMMDKLTTENIYEFKFESTEAQEDIIKHHISLIRKKIDVELGSTNITLKELLEFSEGDVLVLDKKVEDDLVLYIDNIPKYSAKPGRRDNKVAIKITGVAEREESVNE